MALSSAVPADGFAAADAPGAPWPCRQRAQKLLTEHLENVNRLADFNRHSERAADETAAVLNARLKNVRKQLHSEAQAVSAS
jgi:hypothetical protein